MRMPSSQLFRVAAAVALLAFVSVQGAAQATDSAGTPKAAPDSAGMPKAAPDSAPSGYGDSTKQAGVDTSRGKPADSSSRAAQTPRDSGAAQPAAAPALAQDSVLAGACASARGGSVAPGILLVLFRDSATEKERAAAVTGAGGVAAGSAPGGGEYIRVAADSITSRDLADRMVLDPAVATISERRCPSAKP
jgi:hypothetical protein